jgi:hypothetical protein
MDKKPAGERARDLSGKKKPPKRDIKRERIKTGPIESPLTKILGYLVMTAAGIAVAYNIASRAFGASAGPELPEQKIKDVSSPAPHP